MCAIYQSAQDVDIVMSMYNLIEYSNSYSKTSESLWQYYKDELNDNLAGSESFKSKVKITGSTPAGGNTKDVKIIAPLKYLINFWKLKMPLMNCEVILLLTWSSTCVITNSKDYNVMINGKNFFDQPINSELKTYENVRRIATGQGADYTTGCLSDYSYFKDYYKMIAIDLSKQQVHDADPRAIQQTNFTANLDRAGNTTVFLIIEEANQTARLFTRNCKSFLSTIKCNFIDWYNFYQYKMTQYNSLNIKLSNSQLNKSKSAIKNENEVVLRLSSNMIVDDETIFSHILLLINRQVVNLHKALKMLSYQKV